MALAVGFDLDMTLVDSRAGIVATLQHVLASYAVQAPADELWTWIGLPLEDTLGHYLPAEVVDEARVAYRMEYLRSAVAVTTALPGAADSFAAIHAAGGTVVVVSAKHVDSVRAVLSQVGLEPDVVVGDLFGAGKAVALTAHHVGIYVGDHVGDVQGARAAGAVAVAVLTGPNDRASLEQAGADVILEGLQGFPAWLAGTLG